MSQRLKHPFWTGLAVGVVTAAVTGGILLFFLFPLVLQHRADWPLEEQIGTNRVLAAIPEADRRAENPLTPTPESLSAGSALYAGNCLLCHGADGRADTPIGRNLYPPAADLLSRRVTSMSDGELAWITRNGLAFVGMPAFKTLLTDPEIWQIILHIHQLQQQEPTAAAAAAPAPAPETGPPAVAEGQALFVEKGCAACHGADAQGNVGPELAGAPLPFEEFLRIVRSGLGTMPAFGAAVVPDEELRRIYGWLEGGS